MARDIYSKHIEDLTDIENKRITDFIALACLEGEERESTTGN
jgi:hypothetical protein